MPWRPTTSWSPFPPRTTEVQFDEKWSYVAKKEEHCDRLVLGRLGLGQVASEVDGPPVAGDASHVGPLQNAAQSEVQKNGSKYRKGS